MPRDFASRLARLERAAVEARGPGFDAACDAARAEAAVRLAADPDADLLALMGELNARYGPGAGSCAVVNEFLDGPLRAGEAET